MYHSKNNKNGGIKNSVPSSRIEHLEKQIIESNIHYGKNELLFNNVILELLNLIKYEAEKYGSDNNLTLPELIKGTAQLISAYKDKVL